MAELFYTDVNSIDRRIALDGSTVIGRAPGFGVGEVGGRFKTIDEVASYLSKKWLERSRDVALVEQVKAAYASRSLDVDVDSDVSRVHAMIRPVGDGWEILDTFSKDGTYVNGSRLPEFSGRKLSHNDTIALGSSVSLLFKDRSSIKDKLYAYIVSNPQGDDSRRNIIANNFGNELKRRGFDYFISSDSVIAGELELNLAIASERVPVDGYFVFAYMGHGSRDSKFVLNGESYSASQLFRAGANIRGKQIYLLDCCHSGLFLKDANIPHNAAVISSTEEEGKSGRMILLFNFLKLLAQTPDAITLDNSFVEKLRKQGFVASTYRQSPASHIQVSRAVVHSRR